MSLLAEGFLDTVYQVVGAVGIKYVWYFVVLWVFVTVVRAAPSKMKELGERIDKDDEQRVAKYKKFFFAFAAAGFAGGALVGLELGFLTTEVAGVPLSGLIGFSSLVCVVLALAFGLKLKEFFLLKEAGREVA